MVSGHSVELRLARLTLTQFRNYATLTWRPAARIAVITGPNGSGKTNLLEAVSMLVPGRGLRGARLSELARQAADATGSWAVAARFETAEGPLDIGTGTPPDGGAERRVFRLDGDAPRSQAQIAARLSAIWLTPQMDRLFVESPSGRRRFLDRLVLAVEPGHAREVAAYESATARRNRLLADPRADPAWLAGYEDAMVRHGVAATAARAGVVARLNAALAEGAASPFPAARLALLCPIADRLAAEPALAVEDFLRATLARTRAADTASGSSSWGAHRADMGLFDTHGQPAARASTGEQKSLLIATVLGHAALLTRIRRAAPLLLLDEPAVHLDPDRRAALCDVLARLPTQILLTGTDPEPFAPLRGYAERLRTGDDRLRPESFGPGHAA